MSLTCWRRTFLLKRRNSPSVRFLLGTAMLVVVWFAAATVLPRRVIPSPAAVTLAIVSDWRTHFVNVVQTCVEAFGGIALALGVTAVVVLLVARWPAMEQMLMPPLSIMKAVPAVAFVPLLVKLAGTGSLTKIVISALIAFFPLVIGALDGRRSTPRRLGALADVYGASAWSRFRNVEIGFTLTGLLSGLKTAAPLSVVGAIVAEYLAGGESGGVGTFIMTGYVNIASVQVFSGVVMAAAIGVAFYMLAEVMATSANERLHVTR